MARLRAPDGCPWDREQDLASLRSYLLEETYELLEAMDRGDPAAHAEELGDLLLQIVFQAQVGAERGTLDLAAVARAIADKLVRRHPHVFARERTDDSPGALRHWERVKAAERGAERSRLDGVPKTLPALLRATRTAEKAAAIGFDWTDAAHVADKVDEEWRELRDAIAGEPRARVAEELGDLLFALTSLGRHLGVDAESALRGATEKFAGRFRRVEAILRERGLDPARMTPEELDRLWREAKAVEGAR